MNQGMAGLIIGAVFGLILGFFLAPTETASIPGVDGPDLACLEDRQALAIEVRNSLARMADAGCACDEAVLEALPATEPKKVETTPTPIVDGGVPVEPLDVPLVTAVVAGRAVDAGPPPATDAEAATQTDGESTAPSQPATDPNASDLSKSPARQWMVQLIATPESSEAERISAKAAALALPTEVKHELVPALGKKLYKVRVGPFDTKLEGKEAMKTLKDRAGISDGWLHPRR